MLSNGEKYRAKKRAAIILGRLCIIFAVVGIISLVIVFKNYANKIVNNRDEMMKYEKFIQPVVMMDPVPFDSIQYVDQQLIKQSAMWYSLLGENRESYTYDENGMVLVPATDLDVSAQKLFGEGVVINHETFDDYDATYLFDPDIMAYRVPLVAKVSYTAHVESVEKTPEKITLKVGYIAPGNIWTSVSDDNEINVDKYMYYDLTKNPDGVYISAIRDIDESAPAKS